MTNFITGIFGIAALAQKVGRLQDHLSALVELRRRKRRIKSLCE